MCHYITSVASLYAPKMDQNASTYPDRPMLTTYSLIGSNVRLGAEPDLKAGVEL